MISAPTITLLIFCRAGCPHPSVKIIHIFIAAGRGHPALRQRNLLPADHQPFFGFFTSINTNTAANKIDIAVNAVKEPVMKQFAIWYRQNDVQ